MNWRQAMYKKQIERLTDLHKTLDKKIDDHERNHPGTEETRVTEWKKERLQLKDEIRRLTKLQWEHDHETVDFDDR